jgi:hypothetical protein
MGYQNVSAWPFRTLTEKADLKTAVLVSIWCTIEKLAMSSIPYQFGVALNLFLKKISTKNTKIRTLLRVIL